MKNDLIEKNINYMNEDNTDKVSDGFHTFSELYYHRMILFKIILTQNYNKSWKSKKHADGTMFKNYFVVGINTPEGQYTYHYNMEYFEHFKDIKEIDNAPVWDGHMASDIDRLESLLWEECKRFST